MRLLGNDMGILVRALVRVSIIGLRVRTHPRRDLVGVHPHRVVLDPGRELLEHFAVVILTDARVVSIVPAVQSADEVLTFDAPIGKQRASMEAAPVQHRYGVFLLPTNDDKVDALDQSPRGRQRLKFAPQGDLLRLHSSSAGRSASGAHPPIPVLIRRFETE